jgi:hypothetical protein
MGTSKVRLSYYTEEHEMKSIFLRDGGSRMTITNHHYAHVATKLLHERPSDDADIITGGGGVYQAAQIGSYQGV